MTQRRRRATPFALVSVALAVVGLAACGDDSTTGAGTTGTGGDDGGGGTGPVDIYAASEGMSPYDATPSPEGDMIYFTGEDSGGNPGVYAVPAAGGASIVVSVGEPFVTPFGIATGTDGSKLYVADPASDEIGDDGGSIYVLDADGGGTPSPVAGTLGLSPRSLEVREEDGADQLYFSGHTPEGEGGIFKVPAAGGTMQKLTVGDGIMDPSGVTVASNGDVYFVDTIGSGSRLGRVMLLSAGSDAATVLVDDINVGYPAGIALTFDESVLWVSALDAGPLTDIVLLVDLTSLDVTTFTGDDDTSIVDLVEPAGLHRAKNANVFAWADSSKTGAGGTVFVIKQ
jgi:sugar lactone lactonase YvrE